MQLRFSALRTFYKFLIRHGVVESLPIKNLSLPKLEKRLPRFLTKQQMEDLLVAPAKLLESQKQKKGRAGRFRRRFVRAMSRCWRRFIPAACASASCAACAWKTLISTSKSCAFAAREKRSGWCRLARRHWRRFKIIGVSLLEPPVGVQPVFRADTQQGRAAVAVAACRGG